MRKTTIIFNSSGTIISASYYIIGTDNTKDLIAATTIATTVASIIFSSMNRSSLKKLLPRMVAADIMLSIVMLSYYINLTVFVYIDAIAGVIVAPVVMATMNNIAITVNKMYSAKVMKRYSELRQILMGLAGLLSGLCMLVLNQNAIVALTIILSLLTSYSYIRIGKELYNK